MTSCSLRFSSGAQSRAEPKHPVAQTLGFISNSEKKWPPSSLSGGHNVTFSYLLTAEVPSPPLPLPQYITLSYSGLVKKPFTSTGALQYVQGWSKSVVWVKEKKIWTIFPSLMYTEPRGAVGRWLSPSESSCKFRITNTLKPSPSYQVHTHKRHEPEPQHSFRGGHGPLSKGKPYLMNGFINCSLHNTSPSLIKN